MYATADLWLPHFSTGKPLNKINPLPFSISVRTEFSKTESLGIMKFSWYYALVVYEEDFWVC